MKLAINITNCPCRCPGCHSQFLWEDIGTPLTKEELDRLIDENKGITCVCFMGGDKSPDDVLELAEWLKNSQKHKDLKVGWYSGKDSYYDNISFKWFDYIKLGHYDEELGGLDKKTTNQRLFKLTHEDLDDGVKKILFDDITSRFWKKGTV